VIWGTQVSCNEERVFSPIIPKGKCRSRSLTLRDRRFLLCVRRFRLREVLTLIRERPCVVHR
jgi:hypothetical protein